MRAVTVGNQKPDKDYRSRVLGAVGACRALLAWLTMPVFCELSLAISIPH